MVVSFVARPSFKLTIVLLVLLVATSESTLYILHSTSDKSITVTEMNPPAIAKNEKASVLAMQRARTLQQPLTTQKL